MGGQSKCPGETGTTRRESNVVIQQIKERCCTVNPPNANGKAVCSCQNIPDPDNTAGAAFGVIIKNLSPSGMSCVTNSLQLLTHFIRM